MTRIATVLLIVIVITGCAPPFSELQSARLVGKGNVELLPSYTSMSYTEDGEGTGVQNHIGLHAAYGIHEKVDLRMRYEYIWLKDEEFETGASVLGIGPKISFIENYIALNLPFGFAFGDDVDDANWQFHPSVNLTLPAVENKLDITLTPKYIWAFCEGCENAGAVNLGLSISNDLSKWSIRPEYGMLFDFGDNGFFGQFSVGFAATINN